MFNADGTLGGENVPMGAEAAHLGYFLFENQAAHDSYLGVQKQMKE